jgi:hypothetical protein
MVGRTPGGGRTPGRPLWDRKTLIWPGEERVQGDPRGRGGPPYCLVDARRADLLTLLNDIA